MEALRSGSGTGRWQRQDLPVDKNAGYTNLADLRRDRRVENYSKSESASDAPLDHRTDTRALAGRGGLSTELAVINALQSGHIHRAFPMRQRRAKRITGGSPLPRAQIPTRRPMTPQSRINRMMITVPSRFG
jgi:hypothetical protein